MPIWLTWTLGIIGAAGSLLAVISLSLYVIDKKKIKKGKQIDATFKQIFSDYEPKAFEIMPIRAVRRMLIQSSITENFHQKFGKRIVNFEGEIYFPAVNNYYGAKEFKITNETDMNWIKKSATKRIFIKNRYYASDCIDKDYKISCVKAKKIKWIDVIWDLDGNKILFKKGSRHSQLFGRRDYKVLGVNGVEPDSKTLLNIFKPETEESLEMFIHPRQKKYIDRRMKEISVRKDVSNPSYIVGSEMIPYLIKPTKDPFKAPVRCSFSNYVFYNTDIRTCNPFIWESSKWNFYGSFKVWLTKKSAIKYSIKLEVKPKIKNKKQKREK